MPCKSALRNTRPHLCTSRALARLDALYRRYNRRDRVHPDPVEFLYRYDNPSDREVAGLVAASLAYGRVRQIVTSVGFVLDGLGPRPAARLDGASDAELTRALAGFRHRFTGGRKLAGLLRGVREVRRRHGSLESCFCSGLDSHDTVVPALARFVEELCEAAGRPLDHLLPSPRGGSACKRPFLFLRWMVRSDAVDPGGWRGVPPAQLVVPLDVHLHRFGRSLGVTRRRAADLCAAIEITNGFRMIAPDDPVRYDFALNRLGIANAGDLEQLARELRAE